MGLHDQTNFFLANSCFTKFLWNDFEFPESRCEEVQNGLVDVSDVCKCWDHSHETYLATHGRFGKNLPNYFHQNSDFLNARRIDSHELQPYLNKENMTYFSLGKSYLKWIELVVYF